MAKEFKGKSKLSTEPAQTASAAVISVTRRNNTTSGRSPFTARLTEQEWLLLQEWNTQLQQLTTKRLSAAKILRGLLHMKDQIKPDKLIKSIEQNT